MKITLVQPHFKNIWEPLWAGFLSSYLKKNSTTKIELNFWHGNFDSEKQLIKFGEESDIVAFSCTTPTFAKSRELASRIKEKNNNVKIAFGGWHPTSALISYDSVIDFVFYGEGEKQFTNLINSGNWKEDIKAVIYEDNPLDFTQIPWPDRNLINQNRMLDLCYKMCKERIGSLQSIRGCRFRCKMCSEKCMTGEFKIRTRDSEDTLDEIEYLIKDFNVDRIKFSDATWAISEPVVNSFCEAKIRRGIDIKFDAMLHAGTATEEMIKIMAKANCDVFMVGVESGDQRILNDINKGVTISKIKKVFEWGKKYGINRRAFFLLGTPLEDTQSIENTRKLIYEIEPDIVGFTILTPFPGNYYHRKEFKDVDWTNCNEYSNDFYSSPNFTNSELKEIQKKLNKEFEHILVPHQRKN